VFSYIFVIPIIYLIYNNLATLFKNPFKIIRFSAKKKKNYFIGRQSCTIVYNKKDIRKVGNRIALCTTGVECISSVDRKSLLCVFNLYSIINYECPRKTILSNELNTIQHFAFIITKLIKTLHLL